MEELRTRNSSIFFFSNPIPTLTQTSIMYPQFSLNKLIPGPTQPQPQPVLLNQLSNLL